MAKKSNEEPIFFRLGEDDLKALDERVAREQEAHPGRRITRSGLAKELVVALLRSGS